ncbi:MAG TPA: hypothetical protein VNT99_07940 [Methylomirabilota bacterium]|nr:hypothetical protein [Methylomirabilota bacterium]
MLRSTTHAVFCSGVLCAATIEAAETNSFATLAERAFNEANESVRRQPTNVVAFISLAQTAFDWAEFARHDDRRAELAQRGIDAARRAIAGSPTNAAAHYWLGMNIGQLARTKSLGALKLVRELEEAFQRARALDEHIDFAGPDRSLGFLYRDAPGWPASIGSKKKAREHFENAVRLHPEFPANQLALLESFQEWGERQNFARQFIVAGKVMAEVRQKFTGPQWDVNWRDWDERWAVLKSEASEVGKPVQSKGRQ